MEVYSPVLPRITYIGDRAAPGAHPLTWLAQQCEVRVFPENGLDEAMRELERTHVLLLDVHSIHAHLVCQQLRHQERSQQLPVLGLGNRLPAKDVIRLLDHGAVDVVALPTDYEILLAKIRALAHRQIEIAMTRTINHALIRDLEKLRSAQQNNGRAIGEIDRVPGRGGHSPVCALATAAHTDSRGLLEQVEVRAAALPDQVALYVISALASTELLPLNLSSLILNSLTRRVPLSRLGPVHHAFADLVKRHLTMPRPISNGTEMAMLRACDGSAAAVEALRFVAGLPRLLRQ